jgi:hypothetical protein
VILFSVPLRLGGLGFAGLRRGLNRPGRPDLCVVAASGSP